MNVENPFALPGTLHNARPQHPAAKLRIALGFSAVKVAQLLEISVARLHSLESNRSKPTPQELTRLTALYNVDAREVFK